MSSIARGALAKAAVGSSLPPKLKKASLSGGLRQTLEAGGRSRMWLLLGWAEAWVLSLCVEDAAPEERLCGRAVPLA